MKYLRHFLHDIRSEITALKFERLSFENHRNQPCHLNPLSD